MGHGLEAVGGVPDDVGRDHGGKGYDTNQQRLPRPARPGTGVKGGMNDCPQQEIEAGIFA